MSESIVFTPIEHSYRVKVELRSRLYFIETFRRSDGQNDTTVRFTYPCCKREIMGKSSNVPYQAFCQKHQNRAATRIPSQWNSMNREGVSLQSHLEAFFDSWGMSPLEAVMEAESTAPLLLRAAEAYRRAAKDKRPHEAHVYLALL